MCVCVCVLVDKYNRQAHQMPFSGSVVFPFDLVRVQKNWFAFSIQINYNRAEHLSKNIIVKFRCLFRCLNQPKFGNDCNDVGDDGDGFSRNEIFSLAQKNHSFDIGFFFTAQ